MKKWPLSAIFALVLASVAGCSSPAENPAKAPSVSLTPNQVEASAPVYGGIIKGGLNLPRNFDAHQMIAYGPAVTLPVFNQLVMFDTGYQEAVPQTIIGDLADSWETSPDGMEITFHFHQGIKWHDGVPFTADDAVYSLEKMTDPNRSAISDWFPAYNWSESLDDQTVKVHLLYPSAGFMLALAQGESQIQPEHLAGASADAAAFMVGTGPFILEEYKSGVEIRYQRNPEYFKKDKQGNQLPYLDGIIFSKMSDDAANNALVTGKLDLMSAASGTSDANQVRYWQRAAPGLRWQQTEPNKNIVLFLNTKHPPLDDVRVRRALGLVIAPSELIIGYGADPAWGTPGTGLLGPAVGLPAEAVNELMGWKGSVTYQERVDEAKVLLATAGYQNGFKLDILTAGSNVGTPSGNTYKEAGVSVALMNTLRRQLNIDATVSMNLGPLDFQKRLADGDYDIYTAPLNVFDPAQLAGYFASGGKSNYANYANPEMDKMFDGLDRILDPAARPAAVQDIERTLLTDKPALPGAFVPTTVPYYPQVKNLRLSSIVYSNANRLEDVWLDESLRAK